MPKTIRCAIGLCLSKAPAMSVNFWSRHTGAIIGLSLIGLWSAHLYYCLLHFDPEWWHPMTYIHVMIQSHLYTGLFITAHDAMHGIAARDRRWNQALGWVCAGLFAFNYYPVLLRKHHLHHRFVATDQDPDYHAGSFWVWYYHFARQYVTGWQIVAMAVAFNLLIMVLPEPNVILYWMIPSVLATFQLFYFGTYLPHRGEHASDNRHKARSQPVDHLRAFLTCYFFGYHYEHHDSPATPWWQLYRVREANAARGR